MCPNHRNTWPHPPPAALADGSEVPPLKNARVFSHHGVIIDAQNNLRADLSPDFRPPPSGHRVLSYRRLPAVVNLQKEAFLLPAPSSQKNYYHWLLESVPKLSHAPPEIPILTPLSRPFHLETLRAAGITQNLWVELKNNSHFLVPRLHALPPVKVSQTDIDYLRSLFFPKNLPPLSRKIYISRRDTWRRRVRNEEALIAILQKKGFEIHTLTELSIREQAALFCEASHLITPHGASLSNLVFCQKSVKVLELFASNYCYSHYEKLAQQCGLDYHRHISLTDQGDPDFSLDLPSFEITLSAFL